MQLFAVLRVQRLEKGVFFTSHEYKSETKYGILNTGIYIRKEVRPVRRRICLCFMALMLFLGLVNCKAGVLFLPASIREIETEAFSCIGQDAVFIPRSVSLIDPYAFSSDVSTVYGYEGSAAETFAYTTGRTFVSIPYTDSFSPFVPISRITLTSESGNELVTNETLSLKAVSEPEAYGMEAFDFVSLNPDIASVNQSGEVTGISAGRAEIMCLSKDSGGAYAHCMVTVHQGPEKITLSVPDNTLTIGSMMKIAHSVSPEGAYKSAVTFTSSNASIASVDAFGLMTAHKEGIVTITAACENGVSASVTLRVVYAGKPLAMSVSPSSCTLSVGETCSLSYEALPEGADPDARWYSGNTSIATVSASGVVTAKSSGTCLIYVQSTVDTNVFASCKITVLSDSRTLTMPYRRTDTSAVSANLTRINNVKASAFKELESLCAKGMISSSIMNERKSVISEAFSMYSFPWMTKAYQEYWKAENSENGAKDFKPGTVYYGLPYTSDYQNRQYNVEKALSENRYTTAAKGYYLNQNNLLNGKYVGNDCSSMLSISFFGFSSSTATWNTRSFYSSSAFTTLSTSDTLMPGDILVRNGRHVVMFLYYANSAKTQIVVIEQGGSEAGINTISTSLYALSYYYNNSYIPRRLTDWT